LEPLTQLSKARGRILKLGALGALRPFEQGHIKGGFADIWGDIPLKCKVAVEARCLLPEGYTNTRMGDAIANPSSI